MHTHIYSLIINNPNVFLYSAYLKYLQSRFDIAFALVKDDFAMIQPIVTLTLDHIRITSLLANEKDARNGRDCSVNPLNRG